MLSHCSLLQKTNFNRYNSIRQYDKSNFLFIWFKYRNKMKRTILANVLKFRIVFYISENYSIFTIENNYGNNI
jgi:hypothetical protein